MKFNYQLYIAVLLLCIHGSSAAGLVDEVCTSQHRANVGNIFSEVQRSMNQRSMNMKANHGGECRQSKYSSTHEIITNDIAAMDQTSIVDWEVSKSGKEISMTLSNDRSKYSLSVELLHDHCVSYEIYHLVD